MKGELTKPSGPAQRALAKVGNLPSGSPKPKVKSRASDAFKQPAAGAGTNAGTNAQPRFETQPAKRSAVVGANGAGTSHGIQRSPATKQTKLPLTSPSKGPTQSPGPRQKPNPARARAATAVAEPQAPAPRYVAQASKQGIHATNIVNLISDDETSSSEESDDDRPLVQAAAAPASTGAAPAQPVAAKTMVDLTGGDTSDSGQGEGNSGDDISNDEAAENPAENPPQAENGARMVVDMFSSDDDIGAHQQDAAGGVPGGGPQAVCASGSGGVPANNAPDGDASAQHKQSDSEAGSDKDPLCVGREDGAELDRGQAPDEGGGVRGMEGGDKLGEALIAEQRTCVGDSSGAGTSRGIPASDHAQEDPRLAEAWQQTVHAGPQQLQHEPAVSKQTDGDEAMHERAADPDSANPPAEEAACAPATEYIAEDVDRMPKSDVLAKITQALSGGGPSQGKVALSSGPSQVKAERKEDQKVHTAKVNLPKGASDKKQKKNKHSHAQAKYDKKGPMLFHHISRQPLSIGLAATEDLHRRIDREDQEVWQYWVTSLRQRMRQYTMSQEEAHYIFRFEHYRFWLPHSKNALWPSVVEGFILRYRDWIQEDTVVREVCHAHLLHLTRLRLLAPMHTQHCLKTLNGTCTPCPDYMFDHLRPADPEPAVEDDGEDEELAEAERRKEEVAVARLAALQKAAAGSQAVVGLKRPVQVTPKPEPGCSDVHPGELERLLGSVPTDHVSLRVKKELLKLDNTLAKQPGALDAGASTSAPKRKLKLKIKRKHSALPVMFRYVSPSEYPKAANRQVRKRRVRKLSDCIS